jgi:hypothetical protein
MQKLTLRIQKQRQRVHFKQLFHLHAPQQVAWLSH